jgi:alpha-1,4-glucan:alpha-1,4-glucan 6-glycosyltransferase/4-alpha-glucanotransferase
MSSFEEIEALKRLASAVGVATEFTDISGEVHHASPDSLVKVLTALGLPISRLEDVPSAQGWWDDRCQRTLIQPVTVVWEGDPVEFKVNSGDSFVISIKSAAGEVQAVTFESWSVGEQQSLVKSVGSTLPIGYYTLRLESGSNRAQMLVIVAPRSSYRPEGTRQVGLFMPFYALWSKKSWGHADYSDVRQLMKWAARRGISLLGTLPLSAQYFETESTPSPYQPVSRLFWNEQYVDQRRLPEFKGSDRVHRLVATEEFATVVKALNFGSHVDFHRSSALTGKIFQLTMDELSSGNSSARFDEFKTYMVQHPELIDYAQFRTLQEAEGRDWRRWREPNRSGDLSTADLPADRVLYHAYIQWLAGTELCSLAEYGRDAGVELYLDLPLGTHPDGYDAWKFQDRFVNGFSVGAPPDPLGPDGQAWGFAPSHPEAIREHGYDYFRQVIHRHVEIAGALRIDHVMGLHRLYWVPDGLSGREGVYVNYPARELWAIVNLESHLHRCRIVGEDLGTVPDEVRSMMDSSGAGRLYVLPFEIRNEDGGYLRSPSAGTFASLNTHDMFPFSGYWKGLDIEDRLRLGSLAADDCESVKAERDYHRSIIKSKVGLGDDREIVNGAHRFLAESDADTLMVNLEDLWHEEQPQNRPGTVDPEPNWKRRSALSVEQITSDRNIQDQIEAIVRERIKGVETMNPDIETGSKSKKSSRKSPTKSGVAESLPIPAHKVGESKPVFRMTEDDKYLFNEGSHLKLYEKLGAHCGIVDGESGVHFAVWAPDASSIHVIGDFNGWNRKSHPLFSNASSGVWEGFIPGLGKASIYKYLVVSRLNGQQIEKGDPVAYHSETPPKTASIVWDRDYVWADAEWMKSRASSNSLHAPISIYEVHPGSWRRVVEHGDRSLNYRELADQLPEYVRSMGFTHVELMPVMEHPFYGSWGYQTTGYFAATSRYGTPQDLMHLIDRLHQFGIGVILDWVPSHFPADEHGLAWFDGTHLYEHADGRQGYHPDWGSLIFNYGRNEVRSFLLSSAFFWLEQFHADGLRVDAVASMLYLDYSRKEGEWIPNQYGGRENLEAISFLKRLNEEVYRCFPDVQMIAEESTSWPMVSRPTYLGGLGFGLKWDMGWMHDFLDYFSHDPVYRRYHHSSLTFRMLYAWHENFLLPLSHDEVVHGKGSLLGRMPGDVWQKFANLRLLFTSQFTQPGKKLLFMGGEIGQWGEWNHERSLDWHLLDYQNHRGLQALVADLNRIYREEKALHELDCDHRGFEWVDCNDADSSSVSFLRRSRDGESIVIALNFTPVTRHNYRVGVPHSGAWREIFNSDSTFYAGSGQGNLGEVHSTGEVFHGRPDSILFTLPPLSGVMFKG